MLCNNFYEAQLCILLEKEKDAIHQVKKDKKLQDKMKARDSLKPQLSRPMKPKKKKWKKKNKH